MLTASAGQMLAAEDTGPRINAILAAGQADAVCRTYNTWALRHDLHLAPKQLPPATRDFCRSRGFHDDEIYSLLLEPRDASYLQRMSLLHRIARAASGNAASAAETARRLFAFVIREIAPRALPDSHERPEDILVRGYGSCDQACWALAALAEQMGLASMVIFLRDPVSGASPHTIVALRVEERWLLFDPFVGIRFTDGRECDLDLAMALRDPHEWRRRYGKRETGLFRPEHLAWANFLVYTEARGCLPRWSAFTQTTGIAAPRLWFNPMARIEEFHRAISWPQGTSGAAPRHDKESSLAENLKPPASLDCRAYGEPFQMEMAYADRGWLAAQNNSRSQGRFRSARLLHLTGLWDEARRILESTTPQTQAEAEDHLRYRSLALEASGRYEEAIACHETLEKDGGFWAEVSAWHIYKCLHAIGHVAEAARMAERVRGPRRASVSP